MKKLFVIIVLMLLAGTAEAQYVRQLCTSVTLTSADRATCYDYTALKWKYWNGTAWTDTPAPGGTLPTFTTGSVPFGVLGGSLGEDNTNLVWDSTNHKLRINGLVGINRAPTTYSLEITGAITSTAVGAGGNPALIFRGHPSLDLGEIGTYTNHPLILETNGVERVRIFTTGAVQIANLTTSQPVFTDASRNLVSGTISGNTTQVATIAGSKTINKQLAFDSSGNVIASATDIGAGGGGAAIQVNGVALLSSSPANFVDSTYVHFTNPSAGNVVASLTGPLSAALIPTPTASTIGGLKSGLCVTTGDAVRGFDTS